MRVGEGQREEELSRSAAAVIAVGRGATFTGRQVQVHDRRTKTAHTKMSKTGPRKIKRHKKKDKHTSNR